MANMSPVEVTLVLLGAFWAGTSATITAVEFTTKARDKIVSGAVDGTSLSMEHRRYVLCFDWVPMKVSLILVSVMLAVVITMLPSLAEPNPPAQLSTLCNVTAMVPVAGFFAFTLSGILEYRILRRCLKR